MVTEKRLDVLQDEIKLLKAEVKNSLASVRDYLLNMELPSSEFSTILAALAGDNANPQKMDVDSHVPNSRSGNMPKPDLPADKPVNTNEGLNNEPNQLGEYEDLLDFEDTGKGGQVSEALPDEGMLFEEDSMTGKDSLRPQGKRVPEEIPSNDSLDEEESAPEDMLLPEDELVEGDDSDSIQDDDEITEPESELPAEEGKPMEYDRTTNEVNKGIPKVNMLANLINWVARAKREIGYEQLPTFLEVYGISGHLSLELKDVIMRLAEITIDEADAATNSEIWSQSILSLHGILTGGDAPLNPVIPSWVDTADEAESLAEDEIIEIDKAKEKRAKLKLVFPNGNGESKEFCIDLTPEENGNGSV
ncbi:MAG: hypothetical protein A2Z15_02010 [Chloroflexi bacterium RBG_16_50_11]|nr:MAG: hypothetical protein A2Z15_02010 [Chloroflexi bacterium RBG_16_50_11]